VLKSNLIALACVGALLAGPLLPTGVALAGPGHDRAPEGKDHKDAKPQALGTVKIGAYEIEVFQTGKVEPGHEALFQFRLKGDPEPVAIRGWIGLESGKGSAKSKAHKHGQDRDLHCDVPSPLPEGAKLWIEIDTGKDKPKGSVAFK